MENQPSLAETLGQAAARYPALTDFGFFVASARVGISEPWWSWHRICEWQGTFYWFETEREAVPAAKAVISEWWAEDEADDERERGDEDEDEDDADDPSPLDEYSPDFNPIAWRGSLSDLRLSRNEFAEDIRYEFWCGWNPAVEPFFFDMEDWRLSQIVVRGIPDDDEVYDFIGYLRRTYPLLPASERAIG